MKKVLVKFDKEGVCRAIYKFNYEPDISYYKKGLVEIKDENLKEKISPDLFIKKNGKIINNK